MPQTNPIMPEPNDFNEPRNFSVSPRESLDIHSSSEDVSLLPTHYPTGRSKGRLASKPLDNVPFYRLSKVACWFRELFDRNKGLLLIGASQFFMACMSCIVKLMSARDDASTAGQVKVPTLELIAVRMVITWICSVSWMFYQGVPHPLLGPPGIRHWLVFRGVVGFFGLFGIYYSVQYLSLSDAAVITFLSPTVTAFLGYVFLKESFSRREACAGLASFVGVILIARPSFLFGVTRHHHHDLSLSTGDLPALQPFSKR